jgi:hypothetical protein
MVPWIGALVVAALLFAWKLEPAGILDPLWTWMRSTTAFQSAFFETGFVTVFYGTRLFCPSVDVLSDALR